MRRWKITIFKYFIHPKDSSIGIGYSHTFCRPRKQHSDDLTPFLRGPGNGSTDVSKQRIGEIDTVGGYANRHSQANLEVRLSIARDHPLLCHFVGFPLGRQHLKPDSDQVQFANCSNLFIFKYSSFAIANFLVHAALGGSGSLSPRVSTVHRRDLSG
jgi:hypothetical protein